MKFTLEKYSDHHHLALLQVWEDSVRATHLFLRDEDINFYKSIVHTIDFHSLTVYCALDKQKEMAGFLGVSNHKLEMLFLKPEYIGLGLGKKLMHFALKELHVTEVEVNEDNVHAMGFYEKFGFRLKGRRPFDDCGKPYPIVEMSLPTND